MHNSFSVYFAKPLHGSVPTCLGSNPTRIADSHLKRTISTNCCMLMVCLLMMDRGYAQNM